MIEMNGIKEFQIILSIGLPIAVAYLLAIISIVERRVEKKPSKFQFPLRDACIAALALDVMQLFDALTGSMGALGGFNYPYIVVGCLMIAFHLGILSFSKQIDSQNHTDERTERLFLIRNTYIGLLCLMTNSVSIVTLINIAAGGSLAEGGW